MIYCINPGAEEPIMLIDTFIGEETSDTGVVTRGVIGSEFARELLYLDTLKPKAIQLWINSPGGAVSDADIIYSTALKIKTPVDTYNVGMAASSAGALFLVGRKRIALSHSKFMMHNVSGGDDKSRMAFEKGVTEMLSGRISLSADEIKALMDATTWLTAYECRDLGIATEVEEVADMNNPRKKPEDGVTAMHNEYKAIVNKLVDIKKPKINNMDFKKITNKLKLVDSANEEAILGAIEAMEIKNKATVDELDAAKKDLVDKQKECSDLQAKYDKMKSDMEDKEKDVVEAQNKVKLEKLTNDAKTLIGDAVKVGKIANDAGVIEKWEKQAIANFDDTKVIVDGLKAEKKGANIVNHETIKGQGGGAGEEVRPSIDVNNPNAYFQSMQNRKLVNMHKGL